MKLYNIGFIFCYTNCFKAVKKIIHPNSKISLKKEGQVTYNMTLRRACAKSFGVEM
jgi:hypothetical protein